MSKKIGIYLIKNKLTNQCYVGQSIDVEERIKAHTRNHNDRKHYYLYEAIRKYGIDNFEFSIIEECKKEELDEKEMYWIEYYDAYNNGYNMTLGGKGCKGSKSNQKNRNVLPSNFSNYIIKNCDDTVRIAKLDKNYNIVHVYESVQECSRQDNVIATNISKCASLKHLKCNGIMYMYYDEIKEMTADEIIEYRKLLRKKLNFSSTWSNKKRKINLIDEFNNVIKQYNSASEASRELNLDTSSITKVCKGRLHATKGYKFAYAS